MTTASTARHRAARMPCAAALALASLVTAWGCAGGAPGGTPDPATTEAVEPPPMVDVGPEVALPDQPARQFDFWLGEWRVRNRHFRDGSWVDSGPATARIQPVVDDGAVLEQWIGELGGTPLIGFSLRAWDPDLGRWIVELNWHQATPSGFSRMLAVRDGGRMDLFPPGDAPTLRYSFTRPHESSCRWESAKRADDGPWSTEWVMEFVRTGPPLPVDASTAPIVEPPSAATTPVETRMLDRLIGAWEGAARIRRADGTWDAGRAKARVTSMIEGFGLLQFVDTDWGGKSLAALGWDPRADGWMAVRVDNRSPGLIRMDGEVDATMARFTESADDGGPVLREQWSDCDGTHCRFERLRSPDDGATWEPALSVDFVRVSP